MTVCDVTDLCLASAAPTQPAGQPGHGQARVRCPDPERPRTARDRRAHQHHLGGPWPHPLRALRQDRDADTKQYVVKPALRVRLSMLTKNSWLRGWSWVGRDGLSQAALGHRVVRPGRDVRSAHSVGRRLRPRRSVHLHPPPRHDPRSHSPRELPTTRQWHRLRTPGPCAPGRAATWAAACWTPLSRSPCATTCVAPSRVPGSSLPALFPAPLPAPCPRPAPGPRPCSLPGALAPCPAPGSLPLPRLPGPLPAHPRSLRWALQVTPVVEDGAPADAPLAYQAASPDEVTSAPSPEPRPRLISTQAWGVAVRHARWQSCNGRRARAWRSCTASSAC